MARINLLPWREAERKRKTREFLTMLMGGVVITLLIMFYAHIHIEGMIDGQERRNRYLEARIEEVDAQIREISDLSKTKASLLARMNIIQQLQSSRPQIVHLVDELVATLPDGVFLIQVEQKGQQVSIDGWAQSNARVSAYMRNIDASEWLTQPALMVIENRDDTPNGLSKFKLRAGQVAKTEEAEK